MSQCSTLVPQTCWLLPSPGPHHYQAQRHCWQQMQWWWRGTAPQLLQQKRSTIVVLQTWLSRRKGVVCVCGQQKIQFDKVQKHHQNHTHARLTIAAMASSWRGLVKHIYKQSQAIGVASGPHTVLWSHTAPRLLWQRQQHDTQRRWTHSHTQHSNTMRSPLLIRSASTQTGSANARLIQLCRDGDMKQVKALCSPHTVKTLTNSLKPGMERVLPPG